MTPAHRKDDSGIHDHSDERAWHGPSREDWDEMKSLLTSTHQTGVLTAAAVTEVQRAMWGVRSDGINDDGGLIGEVRKLRERRVDSSKTSKWGLSLGITSLIGLVCNYILDKFTK